MCESPPLVLGTVIFDGRTSLFMNIMLKHLTTKVINTMSKCSLRFINDFKDEYNQICLNLVFHACIDNT
jgi:hypothetical protein